jgi:hypothetical protein
MAAAGAVGVRGPAIGNCQQDGTAQKVSIWHVLSPVSKYLGKKLQIEQKHNLSP